MNIEEQPTQQLRSTPPPTPMPGPLNVAGEARETDPDDLDDSTEVLPIDQLLGTTGSAPVAPIFGADPTPAQTARAPAASSSLIDRLRADTTSAARVGWTRSRDWLRQSDNLLVAATVVITLMLLGVVAAF